MNPFENASEEDIRNYLCELAESTSPQYAISIFENKIPEHKRSAGLMLSYALFTQDSDGTLEFFCDCFAPIETPKFFNRERIIDPELKYHKTASNLTKMMKWLAEGIIIVLILLALKFIIGKMPYVTQNWTFNPFSGL